MRQKGPNQHAIGVVFHNTLWEADLLTENAMAPAAWVVIGEPSRVSKDKLDVEVIYCHVFVHQSQCPEKDDDIGWDFCRVNRFCKNISTKGRVASACRIKHMNEK